MYFLNQMLSYSSTYSRLDLLTLELLKATTMDIFNIIQMKSKIELKNHHGLIPAAEAWVADVKGKKKAHITLLLALKFLGHFS